MDHDSSAFEMVGGVAEPAQEPALGGPSAEAVSTPVDSYPDPHDDLRVDYEGTRYDAGHLTVDMTGDGHVDTAVISSAGQVEYYTDNDGDGQADELTITDHSGHLISHEQRQSGDHWAETPLRHGVPDDDALPSETSHAEPASAHSEPARVEVDYEGTRYDAGHPTVDMTGDGHVDTAVISSAGQVEYYTDNDGDGQADELTITDHSGHLISHEQRQSGDHWAETPLPHGIPDDDTLPDR
jgi:hypothetical protein